MRPAASLRVLGVLSFALGWSGCTHRALDVPLPSSFDGTDGGDVADIGPPQDLSTPFPFALTIETAVNGFADCQQGWTINVTASTACEGSGLIFFINGHALGTYPSAPDITSACMSQSVSASYLGDGTQNSPMSGTLTLTRFKWVNEDALEAELDGSYDFTVQDGSGLRFASNFHGTPCTF